MTNHPITQPLSLKDKALKALRIIDRGVDVPIGLKNKALKALKAFRSIDETPGDYSTIRKALEALPND